MIGLQWIKLPAFCLGLICLPTLLPSLAQAVDINSTYVKPRSQPPLSAGGNNYRIGEQRSIQQPAQVQNAPAPKIRTALSPNHIQWCRSTYRSYRERDNTYQPYQGQRQTCSSPFHP